MLPEHIIVIFFTIQVTLHRVFVLLRPEHVHELSLVEQVIIILNRRPILLNHVLLGFHERFQLFLVSSVASKWCIQIVVIDAIVEDQRFGLLFCNELLSVGIQ